MNTILPTLLILAAVVVAQAGMTIRIPAGAKHNLVNTGTEPLKTLISFSSSERKTVFLEETKAK